MTETERKQYIGALLREKAMHLRRGRIDRAEQVDAELARVGYKAAAPRKRAERRPRVKAETRTARKPSEEIIPEEPPEETPVEE